MVSTALVLRTADSLCVMRNFSAHAVSGFQSSTSISSTTATIVTMAQQIAARFSSAAACATKLPIPGNAYV